jgi:hypothetical protein
MVWTMNNPAAATMTVPNLGPVGIVQLEYKPNIAAMVQLKVTFTINGVPISATKDIALVKVTLAAPTFATPGKGVSSGTGNYGFQVRPAAGQIAPVYVTTNRPGSDVPKFKMTSGTQLADEAYQGITTGSGGAGFTSSTSVTLTAPAARPNAITRITIGYIQKLSISGSTVYDFGGGATGIRTLATPSADTVDWYASSATDEWPWYDQSSRWTPANNANTSKMIPLSDSPSRFFPSRYNPLFPLANINNMKPLKSGINVMDFPLYIAAYSIDTNGGMDENLYLYYNQGTSGGWKATPVFPIVVPNVSIVTKGAATWTAPATATALSVNVIPSSLSGQIPFARFVVP